MTRAQQRAVALSCARYQLHQLKVNPLEASAADAHAVLEEYARHSPEMVGAQWYRTATEEEITGFYHAWVRWQRQQRRLLPP
jgi:hypothetical protein